MNAPIPNSNSQAAQAQLSGTYAMWRVPAARLTQPLPTGVDPARRGPWAFVDLLMPHPRPAGQRHPRPRAIPRMLCQTIDTTATTHRFGLSLARSTAGASRTHALALPIDINAQMPRAVPSPGRPWPTFDSAFATSLDISQTVVQHASLAIARPTGITPTRLRLIRVGLTDLAPISPSVHDAWTQYMADQLDIASDALTLELTAIAAMTVTSSSATVRLLEPGPARRQPHDSQTAVA